MKKLVVSTVLATLVSTAAAFDLESYNEANGYWGSDALSYYGALHDRYVSGHISEAAYRDTVLEDYNEANGYAGPDLLTYDEMIHDQVAGGYARYEPARQMYSVRGTLNLDASSYTASAGDSGSDENHGGRN